jgi:hypothetical protein
MADTCLFILPVWYGRRHASLSIRSIVSLDLGRYAGLTLDQRGMQQHDPA